MNKSDYIFTMGIAKMDLAPGKTPPLCDSCSGPFPCGEKDVFFVQALVLSDSLWGLVCELCRQSYFSKIRLRTGAGIPKPALRTLHDVLGKEMQVVWI